MDSPKYDDALFLAIVGAGFTAALASLGFFFRQYQEQKQLARKALFNMLNLWEVVVNVCNPPQEMVEAALEEYKHAVRELFGPSADSINWDHPTMTSMIAPLLVDVVTRYRPGISDDIRKNYASSTEMLAERYPLLAFRLSGNGRLRELFAMIDEYEDRSRQLLTSSVQSNLDNGSVVLGQELTRKLIADDILRQMQADILAVAWKAGVNQWVRCWRLFRRVQGQPMNDRTKKQLREAFKKVLNEWLPKVVQMTAPREGDQRA